MPPKSKRQKNATPKNKKHQTPHRFSRRGVFLSDEGAVRQTQGAVRVSAQDVNAQKAFPAGDGIDTHAAAFKRSDDGALTLDTRQRVTDGGDGRKLRCFALFL